MSFTHASFLEDGTPWTQGTEPRVVFFDAICFSDFWPKITDMVSKVQWRKGSVLFVMGQHLPPESGVEEVQTITVDTSWSSSSAVDRGVVVGSTGMQRKAYNSVVDGVEIPEYVSFRKSAPWNKSFLHTPVI